MSPLRATLADSRPSCREAVLDAIDRLAQRTGTAALARHDIVAEVEKAGVGFDRSTICRGIRRMSGRELRENGFPVTIAEWPGSVLFTYRQVGPAQPAVGQHRLDGRPVEPLDRIIGRRGGGKHARLAHPQAVGEMRLRDGGHPGRALGLGMPLTFIGIALLTKACTPLDWTASFLVGAILSPTDPVFAAAIVGRTDVPIRLRRLLNVESGLNDGLALPVVVVLIVS